MHSAHAPPVLRCVGAQQAPAWAAQLCCKITHIQLFFSVSIIITVDNSPVAHVRRPSGARPGVRGVYGSFVSPICPEKGREKGEVCVTLIIAAAKPLRIDMKSCSQLRVQGGGVFNDGLYGLQGPCVRRMMPHSLHVGHVRRSATGQTSSILKRLNRGVTLSSRTFPRNMHTGVHFFFLSLCLSGGLP